MSEYSKKSYNVVISEEFFINNINIDVYTRTWEPENVKPRAHIVFIHGLAEHVNRYDHVFNEFAKVGLKVHAFDQVGCGKTGVKSNDLGGAMGLKQVLLDTDDAIDRIHDSSIPLFLMGHSFGGTAILKYLINGNRRDLLSGSLISAPCVKIAKESDLNIIERTALSLLSPLIPRYKFATSFDPRRLSRDKSAIQKYCDDTLIFTSCSLIQVKDILSEGPALLADLYKDIKTPLLYISHGTGDQVTSFSATRELVNKLRAHNNNCPNVELKEYTGGYHELHNDINKDEVIADYCDWLLKHS